ncbi:polysaccharide deacetylase family protein [Streptomyces sp. SPB162]|uniref:polysaccharide deacetylase family protein n=1 Tax=Streptomyces sp. SPB162 TaxID=2940560 RepID=UPI002406D0DB|nr:polysaccharide deacetylase family protein [Streptomyces sp. SPB162]MDF9814888.1 peptidoglycan/xylan/chitin deacetylase (PgdA/CDA1 family) [Streptomyces sp. SPB162]
MKPRTALLPVVTVLTAILTLTAAPARPATALCPSGGTATPALPADLLGRTVRTMPAQQQMPVQKQVIALTFNAAWDETGLDAVLKVLRDDAAPATFFLTGQFADAHPAAARSMAAAGHGIASHSYSHPHFGELTCEGREREVRLADQALRTATGTAPLPFFRFPYGETTDQQVAEVNALGFADIEWTADTNGYLNTAGGMTVQKAVSRALDALTPGEIVQMHVGDPNGRDTILDAQALPLIIDAVRARGYEIADLRTLLAPPAA